MPQNRQEASGPIQPDGSRKPRWRKVHLDYHNSHHISSVGENFDQAEFVETLVKAHVDSIVVFAKDMHGYCYFPTLVGTQHPGLRRDLLGEQVAACQAAGIEVSAYICTLWDNLLAASNPEVLSIKRDGKSYLPEAGQPPDWTAVCASNESVVQYQIDLAQDVLNNYTVDGVWFDMPCPRDAECFCPRCMHGIRAMDGDPYDTSTQRHYQHSLHKSFLRQVYDACHAVRPGCQVDFNNQPAFGLGERQEWMDNIDIEALPTAQWGYDFFPLVARYTRTYDLESFGMTGRFMRGWGDFGGLKSSAQIRAEAFHIVSLGCRCDVGDQLQPDGKLDPEVYGAIGSAFGEIEKLETYLEGSRPAAELALLVEGMPLDTLATPSACGLAKALAELSVQFNVVEAEGPWEEYGLVIFEGGKVSPEFGARLESFVNNGGKVLLCGEAASWGGVDAWGPAKVQPAYAVAPGEGGEDYAFALYGPSWSWIGDGDALAREGLADFARSGQHYTSHAQTPYSRLSGRVSAEVAGSVGRIGFGVGEMYSTTGYWFAREILSRVLDRLMPNRLVRLPHGGPVLATLATAKQEGRWLFHIFDSSVARPAAGHPPYYEAGPPRGPIRIELGLPGKAISARAIRGQLDLTPGSALTLPSLDRYELLVLDVGGNDASPSTTS